MVLCLIGFLIGFLIPSISSRFGKILPADPGLVLLELIHFPRFPKVASVIHMRRLYQKWQKLLLYSCLWGISLSILFLFVQLFLPAIFVPWAVLFCIIISFCIVIDNLFCLLPDFFTLPLLIIGFAAAVFSPTIDVINSVLGASFGYLISVFAVLLLGFAKNAELGAGDVKMMTALGAWLGIPGLNFTFLLSFFLFVIPATIKLKNQGPYGPALGIAAIISLFIMYSV